MPPRLEFRSISKFFGGRAALDRLTLALEPGEILGFLGPNGAGKTTAIHLALGFLHPTSGGGSLLGRPFGSAEARARLGFVPDQPVFFGERAAASVEFAARLNGVRDPRLKERIHALLADTGLKARSRDEKKDVRRFSRGMQQRLALAQALVNDPELIILDEPTSGLDPAGVLEVRELLLEARRAGKSIFFSSHQLTEVERISDRIAFLHRGRLVRQGALEALLHSSNRMEAQVRNLSREEAGRIFPRLDLAAEDGTRRDAGAEANGGGMLRLSFACEEQRAVLEALWNAGGEVVSLAPSRSTLEELFLAWSSDTWSSEDWNRSRSDAAENRSGDEGNSRDEANGEKKDMEK